MKKKANILILMFLTTLHLFAQVNVEFTTLDSVLNYAKSNSVTLKNNQLQLKLADWQKKSAKIGVVNFKMQSSFSLIDNILLPVTFLPGEAFGGEPGSFKEVTTGQPYIGNLTIAPQVDLINVTNWSKVKSSKVNEEVTINNNLLTSKTHYESIAAAYYNILSLKEQIKITQQNADISDSLYLLINEKFNQGLVRKQDLNDVIINQVNIKGKLEQLNILLEQQYLGLKILCDISPNTKLEITEELNYNMKFDLNTKSNNQLLYKSSLLKIDQVNADLRTNRYSQLPTLSLVGYSAWQQNSSVSFFDKDRNWINSQYVGLKINLPFPDLNKHFLSKSLEINKEIAILNAQHTKTYNDLNNEQISLDYQKGLSQLTTSKKVYLLKEENYKMVKNQFEEGIISTDKLLIAFNDLLISQIDYGNTLATLQFTKSKININNTIK